MGVGLLQLLEGKDSARPECVAGCRVQVLSVQLPEGTRRGLDLFCLRDLVSFCPRNLEDPGGPALGALSRVGVLSRPPSPLPAGVSAPLSASGWARPRACVTAGLGAESCRAGHPAPFSPCALPPPAARRRLRRLHRGAGRLRARLGLWSALPSPTPARAAAPNPRRRLSAAARFPDRQPGIGRPAQAPGPAAPCSPAR